MRRSTSLGASGMLLAVVVAACAGPGATGTTLTTGARVTDASAAGTLRAWSGERAGAAGGTDRCGPSGFFGGSRVGVPQTVLRTGVIRVIAVKRVFRLVG